MLNRLKKKLAEMRSERKGSGDPAAGLLVPLDEAELCMVAGGDGDGDSGDSGGSGDTGGATGDSGGCIDGEDSCMADGLGGIGDMAQGYAE
jgi:hypothetical protein